MSPEPPVPDVTAGILVYATRGPRRPARMKVELEDFQVEELVDLGKEDDGPYPIYRVEKRGVSTLDAVDVMERALRSRVSFAGLKDKKAIAVQYMSPTSTRSASPVEVTDRGVRAELVGHSASPIRRVMLLGNRFRITLRGTDPGMVESVEMAYSSCLRREIPNFFGYQRFGLRADTNHRVGRAIIRRDFASAVSLIVGEPRIGEVDEIAGARRDFREGNYSSARRVFVKYRYPEGRVVGRLQDREGDHLGALRTLPITIRRLFVNAYQAYIFNRVLSASAKQGLELARATRGDNWAALAPDRLRVGKVHGVREQPLGDGSLPLVQIVGYAFRDYGSRFDILIRDELASEGTDPKQFYIKEAEEMSSEGGFRHAPLLARDLGYRSTPDGIALEFSLSKGEYATILLREVVKPEDPLESGF